VNLTVNGKIIAIQGKRIKVYYDSKVYESYVRGKLLKDRLDASPVAVGDNVLISIGENDTVTIEKILPRRQILARPDILVKGKKQVIATNLDQLVIISSTRSPDFKPGLIDRFLVSAEIEKLTAAVVINKIDLALENEFAMYSDAWESVGYNVVFTSAKDHLGLNGFKKLLNEKSSVLAGHSGVGKSSLLNAIQPQLDLQTKQISRHSGRGVHTTSSVIMYPLEAGGWVVDTPGLKIFGLQGIDKKHLYRCFPEIRDHDDDCRFADCSHINEPDCAIKDSVTTGKISEFRYQSYKKFWQQIDK